MAGVHRRADDRPMSINTLGLVLAFGWAAYVIAAWLIYQIDPQAGTAPAMLGAVYLAAVGALLTYVAVGGLRFGRHRTQQRVIGRTTSPVGFWTLTSAMGGCGIGLLGAGAYALISTVLLR